ncbi:GNAT family N-acetyltransferase [Candidatus Bipolaricaulota bacterium]
MNGLPEKHTARPASVDDIDAIVDIVNQYGIQLTGEALYPPEYVRRFLTLPGFDLADSSKLVFSPRGSISGLGLVMDIQAPYVQVSGWGLVPEAEQGRGIGSTLHTWIESRARKAIAKAPEGTRVALMQTVFDQDGPAKAHLERLGYEQTRHFWRMAVDLDQALPSPSWPDGIAVQNVDLRKDLEHSLRAANEAFRDHYGHVDGDFEQQLERQQHNVENDPEYTSDLSFLALDNEEIAGVCFCSPRSGTDTSAGYVNSLAVLRPWRKRGLGLALLLHAFHVLREMGKVRAALHVDAESPTGATRLYEKADMHVDQLSHEYQLELRAGVDLAAE